MKIPLSLTFLLNCIQAIFNFSINGLEWVGSSLRLITNLTITTIRIGENKKYITLLIFHLRWL